MTLSTLRKPHPISLRLPDRLDREVRSLAAGEDERPSVVVRRLIRLGLERTRETHSGDEAA
jgi:predicted transcriptional regulator